MTSSDNPTSPKPQVRRRRQSGRADAGIEANARASLPRLREVAAAAGVSTASVSRALNAPDTVSEMLRLRVAEAAGRLGYVADGAGRTLASRRSGLIGVLVASLAEPDYGPLLAVLERRFAAAGYFLLVCAASAETSALQGRAVIARGVEGLVLAGFQPAPELVALAASRRIPCVATGATAVEGVVNVGLELARAGETVARYLFDLGHRRFALLVPGVGAGEAAVARTAALRHALRTLPGSRTVEWGVAAGDAYLAARVTTGKGLDGALPTAIVCPDDRLAAGSLHACLAAGIAVPATLSIVGFGDSVGARQSQPPLTTLRDPAAETGWALADSVLCRLAGEPVPPPAIAVKLIVRGTTGPAAR